MQLYPPAHGGSCSCHHCLTALVHAAVRDVLAESSATSPPAGPAKGLYTGREAAAWLGCSASKVAQWRDRGLLPAVRMDRCVRYRLEDLEGFRDRWQPYRHDASA